MPIADLRTKARVTGVAPSLVFGVGVSVPGQVERERGLSVFAPNWGWHDVPLRDLLSEKLLWKEFKAGQTIIVDSRDGEIVFEPAPTTPDVPPVERAGQQES